MTDDLLPHSSPRVPADTPVKARSVARVDEPVERAAPRRPRTHKREIVFGVVLAIAAAIGITWWVTSSREPKPTFLREPATNTTVPSNSDVISGAEPPPALMAAYGAVHDTYVASGSYEAISLSDLAAKLPGVTVQDGAASSTNASVVSLLVPSTDRVVLAVRDDAGCSWLRDFGAGAQIARETQVVISCSAAAAPTTGWSGA